MNNVQQSKRTSIFASTASVSTGALVGGAVAYLAAGALAKAATAGAVASEAAAIESTAAFSLGAVGTVLASPVVVGAAIGCVVGGGVAYGTRKLINRQLGKRAGRTGPTRVVCNETAAEEVEAAVEVAQPSAQAENSDLTQVAQNNGETTAEQLHAGDKQSKQNKQRQAA